MQQITNTPLMPPCTYLSTDEKRGDKQVIAFDDNLIYIEDHKIGTSSSPSIRSTSIALPIAASLGGLVKLGSLHDQNYRVFGVKNIPQNSTYHPKLFEMFQHVQSTTDFIKNNSNLDRVDFKPLDLYECPCEGFSRFRSHRRNNLENAIVQQLAVSRHDKNQILSILSMGSGGLLSDFLILEKLILVGFKNISMDCVDPEGIDNNRVEKIKLFFSDYPEASIKVEAYKKIDDVSSEKPGYAAVLAIDYDTLTSFNVKKSFICAGDLIKAYRRLSGTGFIGLGFSDDEDSLFGPQIAPVILNSRPSLIHGLASDLTQQLSQKDLLSIIIPRLNFADAPKIFLFSLALALEKLGIAYSNISVISLSLKKHENEEVILEFQTMAQTFFPKTKVELCFEDGKPKACDILLTGSHENDFISKKYPSYLNPQSTMYILYPGGKIYRQKGALEDQKVEIR